MDYPEKALPRVVTGLIAKRAEIAGEVEHLQSVLKAKVCELDHIEASICIFDPDLALGAGEIGSYRLLYPLPNTGSER